MVEDGRTGFVVAPARPRAGGCRLTPAREPGAGAADGCRGLRKLEREWSPATVAEQTMRVYERSSHHTATRASSTYNTAGAGESVGIVVHRPLVHGAPAVVGAVLVARADVRLREDQPCALPDAEHPVELARLQQRADNRNHRSTGTSATRCLSAETPTAQDAVPRACGATRSVEAGALSGAAGNVQEPQRVVGPGGRSTLDLEHVPVAPGRPVSGQPVSPRHLIHALTTASRCTWSSPQRNNRAPPRPRGSTNLAAHLPEWAWRRLARASPIAVELPAAGRGARAPPGDHQSLSVPSSMSPTHNRLERPTSTGCLAAEAALGSSAGSGARPFLEPLLGGCRREHNRTARGYKRGDRDAEAQLIQRALTAETALSSRAGRSLKRTFAFPV